MFFRFLSARWVRGTRGGASPLPAADVSGGESPTRHQWRAERQRRAARKDVTRRGGSLGTPERRQGARTGRQGRQATQCPKPYGQEEPIQKTITPGETHLGPVDFSHHAADRFDFERCCRFLDGSFRVSQPKALPKTWMPTSDSFSSAPRNVSSMMNLRNFRRRGDAAKERLPRTRSSSARVASFSGVEDDSVIAQCHGSLGREPTDHSTHGTEKSNPLRYLTCLTYPISIKPG
jgi:hypothetical protein